jgi:outer membrane receptor protein involved in Fe transport
MEAGVENLFNEDYNEHLTREALLPVGDLKQGDEVPAPGRSFQISFRLDF